MNTNLKCWCGKHTQFSPFSENYILCHACQTLIWSGSIDNSIENAKDDKVYYGLNYWLEHQNELGLPNIHIRMRTDLVDRIPYWADMIMKYCLPPGKIMDVGSSHGGLVAFLQRTGFDAIGLEVSPELASFSQQTFGATTLTGFIENQQQLEAESFDVITLMDVVEHLQNPSETLRHCTALLNPNGLVVIQTPEFPDNLSYSELVTAGHPFLKMMIPREHRFLFSKHSLERLLQQLGYEDIRFEQALFDHDMFCFASKQAFSLHSLEQVRSALLSSPNQRFSLAMIELFREKQHWFNFYSQADRDRIERLKVIENQAECLKEQARSLREHANLAQKRIQAFKDLITNLQNSSSYKLLLKLKRLSWFDQKARRLMAAQPIAITPEDVQVLRNRKLKLAIDLTPVRPGGENGGAKIMALNLIRHWSKILAPNWEYLLLTSAISHDELACLDRGNVKRICVNFNAGTLQESVEKKASLRIRIRKIYQQSVPVNWRLRLESLTKHLSEESKGSSILKKVGADILFCPFTAPLYHDPDVPIVIVVHDLQYIYYPWFFTPEDLYHTNRYFQQSVEVAKLLICVSEFTRKTVIENSNIEPRRVKTIRSCLFNPLPQVAEDRLAQILNERGLSKGKFLFFPANFWQHKNHQMLILAFSQFLHQNPSLSIKLVFTGAPGPRMDFLVVSVNKMGLQENVIFLGYVSDEEMAVMYRACKAVIFPSLFEGFGVPVLEAMSYGKPVLCSNVTSLPEVGGDAVFYFDPRRIESIVSAIARIVSNSIFADELSNRGLIRSIEFGTSESWAAAYLDELCQAYTEAGRT